MMNFINKFKYFILGGIVVFSGVVYAVQITVPAPPILGSPSGGYMLVSTTTGNWIATSTATAIFGNYISTSTRTSIFPYASSTIYSSFLTSSSTFGFFGSLTVSTTTAGCAAFMSTGLLVSTGAGCGTGSGGTSAFEIATTTDIAQSQVAYISKTSGRTTLASVATSSITSGASITVTNGTSAYVLGSQPSFAINLGNTNTWTVLQNFNYSSSTLYSSFVTSSSTFDNVGTLALSTSTLGCLEVGAGGVLFSKGTACGSSAGLTSYDAWTHSTQYPFNSATTSRISISTTTSYYTFTVASTTGPQIALADGTAGIAEWVFRNAGGNFYLATTTVAGTATTSTSALTINGTSGLLSYTYSSSTIYSSFLTSSSTFNNVGTQTFATSTLGCAQIGAGGVLFSTGSSCGTSSGLSAYDAWTHSTQYPFNSATTSNIAVGTTTPYYSLTVASTTGPQFALSDGTSGIPQWVFRNAGGSLYIATTTVAGTSTTTIPAIAFTGGQILIPDGSGSAPAISFLDDPNNGIGSPANDVFAIYTNGLERFRIHDGTGSSGFGTTTFSQNLLTLGSSTAPQLALSDNTVGDSQWVFRNTGGNFYLATSSVTGLATTSTTALMIDNSGNVSFGSTSPSMSLNNSQFQIATPYVFDTGIGSSVAGVSTTTRAFYLVPPPFMSGRAATLKATNYRAFEIAPYLFTLASSTTSKNLYGSVFNAYTVGTTSTMTATTSSTVYISGAPVASSTGAATLTISTSTALLIDTASVATSGGVVTNAYGLQVYAPSGATNNIAASFIGSVGIGTSTPSGFFSVGSSTITAFNWNGTNSKIGIGCENASNARIAIGCGSNANVNGNINPLIQDPADARFGAAVSNLGVFIKSDGGLYSYDYTNALPRTLNLQEFSAGAIGVVTIATTTQNGLGRLTIASTTGSQLQLSAGAGVPMWTFRNAGGDMSFSTTTITGSATTSTAAVTFCGQTTCKPGLSISSSTPFATFSVNNIPNDFTSQFAIGSSTWTSFVVLGNGNTGIGTSTPQFTLGVVGTMAVTGLPASTAGNAVCIVATQFVNAGGATCATSSLWTKHNVIDIDSKTASEISNLRAISYTNNEDGSKHYGFIAEEVAKIDPLLVEYAKEDFVLPNGHTIKKGEPLSIDYLRGWALLVKYVQDLKVGKVARSAEENWQWIVITLLSLGFVYQQKQINKLKRQ